MSWLLDFGFNMTEQLSLSGVANNTNEMKRITTILATLYYIVNNPGQTVQWHKDFSMKLPQVKHRQTKKLQNLNFTSKDLLGFCS